MFCLSIVEQMTSAQEAVAVGENLSKRKEAVHILNGISFLIKSWKKDSYFM